MRSVYLSLILLGLVSGKSMAQNGEYVIEGDLQPDTYQEVSAQNIQTNTGAAQELPQARRVLILNRSQNVNVQQQPVTNVEATPLTDSRAAQLRRAREDAEVSTEQKIVEKLEQSRLEDEKRRANALFGNKLDEQNNIQEAAPVQVQVIPVQQEQNQGQNLEAVKNDIISSVREELNAKSEKEEVASQAYISGSIGVTSYSGAVNVESNEAMGVSVGSRLDSNFIVEGSFLYSNHYVDNLNQSSSRYFVYDDLDQYNFLIGAKYAPQFGRISPQIGALVSYTHRIYTQINQTSSYFDSRTESQGESKTDSIDVGLSLGMDIKISDNFVIGAEYKFITNLTNRSDSRLLDDYYSFYDIGTPLEEFDYSSFGLVGKILF